MNKSGYHIIQLLCIILSVGFTSCRPDLCYNHFPAAIFQLSWEQEWERDYGMTHSSNWDTGHYGFEYDLLRPGMPGWVNLVCYHDDGKVSEKYLSKDGGEMILADDNYESLLLYNGDTEYIVLSDVASLNYARASATPRSRSSISYIQGIYPDTHSTNPPDILYSAYISDVPQVQMHEKRHMPVKLHPLVFTYVVRYEFEYGLKHVSIARGALGGMAESVYLRTGTTSDNPTIILYDCDVKDYGCEAHVRSFGIPGFPDEYFGRSGDESDDRKYTLNLEVKLTNGKTIEFNYDITDQIQKQPRGGVITVSGIRIEDEENLVDSDFNVDVGDWGTAVDIDLPIK